MGFFTFISVILIRLFAHNQELKSIAVFLFVIGTTLTFLFPYSFEVLKIIPIMFFLKLILGYAVGVFSKDN